jgi:hypothetical protein
VESRLDRVLVIRILTLMTDTLLVTMFSARPTAAENCYAETVTVTIQGALQTTSHLICPGSSAGLTENVDLPSQQALTNACAATVAVLDLPLVLYCFADDAEAPELTPAIVASAFRRIPLPPSKLIVQPPNGRTLVNFATNFYTETGPFTRSVTLLGQRVELEITPASYTWNFGDGGSTSTSSPGAAYPDLEVTHAYLRKGRVAPSVDTTYTATYRVNGGPAQPVPGSVTVAGGPVSLQVVTASPQLVG